MSLYRCESCGCVENTSCADYHYYHHTKGITQCSECNPEIGEWHGRFEKHSADGMLLCSDGYVYSHPPNHVPVVGVIGDDTGVEFNKIIGFIVMDVIPKKKPITVNQVVKAVRHYERLVVIETLNRLHDSGEIVKKNVIRRARPQHTT